MKETKKKVRSLGFGCNFRENVFDRNRDVKGDPSLVRSPRRKREKKEKQGKTSEHGGEGERRVDQRWRKKGSRNSRFAYMLISAF